MKIGIMGTGGVGGYMGGRAERMWWKLSGICGVSIFAVMRGDKATVWAPETAALVRQAVAEVVAVAQAHS